MRLGVESASEPAQLSAGRVGPWRSFGAGVPLKQACVEGHPTAPVPLVNYLWLNCGRTIVPYRVWSVFHSPLIRP